MFTDISPKLPMRNKTLTKEFYIHKLGFRLFGSVDYDGYLMVQKDNIQIHFFEFKELSKKKVLVLSWLNILPNCRKEEDFAINW